MTRRLLAILVSLGLLGHGVASADDEARFAAYPNVAIHGVRPFGVDLGGWTSWGNERLARNVVRNPGFEPTLDVAVVLVGGSQREGFSEAAGWQTRPDHFWRDANYEVRTGRFAGRSGSIRDSWEKPPKGVPHFVTANPFPDVAKGDVVVLSRVIAPMNPDCWNVEAKDRTRVRSMPGHRPGGSGQTCLMLSPLQGAPAIISTTLDSAATKPHTRLPITGRWRLSFWYRAEQPGTFLEASVYRSARASLVNPIMSPSEEWEKGTFDFLGDDDGKGSLTLMFKATGNGQIMIDDVALTPLDGKEPFRSGVVSALRRLHPGYLRDWQGQSGDTLGNRLADDFSRMPCRSWKGAGTFFFYSLPDFLALCHAVDARPWVVVPATLSDDEYIRFGRFLAEQQALFGFPDVVVEFANEVGSPLFLSNGLTSIAAHAAAADRAFVNIAAGNAGRAHLLYAIDGPTEKPSAAADTFIQTTHANCLALFPYLARKLDKGLDDAAALAVLFEDGTAALQEIRSNMRDGAFPQIVSAEVNLRPTEGTASIDQRNRIVSSAAAGTALANHMLRCLSAGVRAQCASSLTGYETYAPKAAAYVRGTGLTREQASLSVFRPTGLAVEMLNRCLVGDLMETHASDARSPVNVWTFRTEHKWRAAITSTSPREQKVVIEFPDPVAGMTASSLAAAQPFADNEEKVQVSIRPLPVRVVFNTLEVRVPPYGFVILTDGSAP